MKKFCLCILALTLTLSLTACTANWFGDTVETPWYMIAVFIVLISLCACGLVMSRTYVCPRCNTEFKSKPYQLYTTIHMNRKRLAKCPNCKKIRFCETKRG